MSDRKAGEPINVYEVSDAIKERFRDDSEGLVPRIALTILDRQEIVWETDMYLLDDVDVRKVIDLCNQFGLSAAITSNIKEHDLRIKFSTKASSLNLDEQKFSLREIH